jgi:hypothetical protein
LTPAVALCPEASALGSLAQGSSRETAVDQRGQGHEARGAGNGRHDEPHQRVKDRSREELTEGCRVARVRSSQVVQISRAFPLANDHRRVAETDQEEIGHQSAGASVAVEERMDSLELGVDGGERLGQGALGSRQGRRLSGAAGAVDRRAG